MMSESQLVVENGIRNFKNEKRGINSSTFYNLAESMDQDLAINFLIHPSSTPLTRSFFPNTPLFPNTGRDWIELDLEVSESEVNLIGVAFLNDSIPDGLNLVKNIKPQKLFLTKMVPGNFSSYLGFPLDNIDQLESNFKGLSRRINLAVKKKNLYVIKNLKEIACIES